MAARPEASKFSLALGNAKKPPAHTRTKRPHSALQDSDDEEGAPGRTQDISHFDEAAGGAIDESRPVEKRGPLVIEGRGNRDWREESRRKKMRSGGGLPEGEAQRNGGRTEELNKGPDRFGLVVVEKSGEGEEAVEGAKDEAVVAAAPAEPKTDDQRAMEALLGDKPKSTAVIPVASEEEAFQRDYENAPDMATLEEYDAVPVEEFGAALLRGMGWKEGEAIGRRKGQKAVQPRVLERRPALLGIGAKSEAAIGIELGTWGKDAKGPKGGSRRKVEQAYNPVLLKNSKTGETLTEEELKAKMEAQKAEEMELQLSKSRNESLSRDPDIRSRDTKSSRRKYDDDYDSDARDKDRGRREKERDGRNYRDKERDHRDRDYDSKHRSSRRDRSASADRSDRRPRRDRDDRDRRDDRKYRDDDDDRHRKSSSRREHRERDSGRDSGRDSERRRRR